MYMMYMYMMYLYICMALIQKFREVEVAEGLLCQGYVMK